MFLTDHINLRLRELRWEYHSRIHFYEIKKFYYQEYLIGKVAIGMIERTEGYASQDEAAFIACILHAELDLDMTEMVSL